jgi:hypothetical protein
MATKLMAQGKTGPLVEAIPALRAAAMEEAGEEGVKSILSAAFVHFPQPRRVPEEWAVFWQGYVGSCGHLSRAALEAGMLRWLNDPQSQFLPKPGELRALATQTPTEAHQVLNKARAILDAVAEEEARQRVAKDIAERGTTAERQAQSVRQMMAGLDAELTAAAARQRDGMVRRAIPHANRCVRPEGEINAVQAEILKKCGVTP